MLTTSIYPIPSPAPKQSLPNQTADLTILVSDEKAIARLIDRLLERANLSDVELAARLGIQTSTLYQYRVGRRKRPSIQWLVKLVSACGGHIFLQYPSEPLIKG